MLIIGLLIGLVSVVARPDDRGRLHIEAERLARLLDLAAAESRLTGRSIGWTSDGTAYQFLESRDEGGWLEIRDSGSLRSRDLPPGMTIASLRVEAMQPRGAMRLEFVPYGPALAFTVEMSLGADRYTIAASPIGAVVALPGTGNTNVGPAR